MSGIHHVTAIAGSAARNNDFYTRILRLRFGKKTVNFDDPGSYHLYYGDESGRPGSALTFVPWDHAAPGRAGIGLAQQTSFRIPASALGFWAHRFVEYGVPHETIDRRFGEPVLEFQDPDGMSLALMGVEDAENEAAWTGGGIAGEHAIRGFHGVTLLLAEAAPTGEILTAVLGFSEEGREGSYVRYRAAAREGGVVDIHDAGSFLSGHIGRGSVHHVAFRATDDAEQAAMAEKLVAEHGMQVTEQRDRHYFRSVYFREPGGVLFEIATDAPGFTVDEPLASWGKG